MKKDSYVIAVDGFSSCGKSTLAKQIADETGFMYVDSGAMYRAVCLFAIRNKFFVGDKPDLEKLKLFLDKIKIHFKKINSENHTFLNNEDVSNEIRSMQVSNLVSKLSRLQIVREKLVKMQQKMSENNSIVMDGRDIGTVVFPDADLKIFLTADEKIRASRRYKELKEKGQDVEFENVIKNIKERDKIDTTRKISPLKKAEDAKTIDNSNLSKKQQLEIALKLFNEVKDEN